jgi:quercetin dioxygenase-like cupin family protein
MPENYRVERWAGELGPDPATLWRKMRDEGYSVYEWSDRPGTEYDLHSHDDEQSHWVLSGELELLVNNVGVFSLGPGDRDFMPADTPHSARVIGIDPVVYLIGSYRERA